MRAVKNDLAKAAQFPSEYLSAFQEYEQIRKLEQASDGDSPKLTYEGAWLRREPG